MIRLKIVAPVAAFLVIGLADAGDGAERIADACAAPAALVQLRAPLTHAALRIERRETLTIVAFGSSSTQGVGASAPDLSYPSRLEAELRQRFPEVPVRVINRGKGGEDAGEEMARLDRDVVGEHPDLVIWQVGTNAVLRRDDLVLDGRLIEDGVRRMEKSGSDVVLMDLQYAPRVIAKPTFATMERLIAEAAVETGVGLFRRFDIMRYWQTAQEQPQRMIGPDGLHMTDQGYGCLAADLADALAANWRSQEKLAHERPTGGEALHHAAVRLVDSPQ